MVSVRRGFLLGAATHTGRVRATNEDDYLLMRLDHAPDGGLLAVVADGMGGVIGGAEASRTAVRALAAAFAAAIDCAGHERMRRGFEAACQAVFQAAQSSGTLRGMGTTLTALYVTPTSAVVGHVGDSRCLRARRGQLEQLTTDHSLPSSENQLTRCIGAGREHEACDISEIEVEPGDLFLLCTDGLWGQVKAADSQALLASMTPRDAADELVQRSYMAGGVDNATAVIVKWAGPVDGSHDLDLHGEERRLRFEVPATALGWRRARWPFLVWGIAALFGGAAILKYHSGINALEALGQWLRGWFS